MPNFSDFSKFAILQLVKIIVKFLNFFFRNVRPHLENLHKYIQSMDGKRKKDTKVVETKEKTKSPKSPKSEGECAKSFQKVVVNLQRK